MANTITLTSRLTRDPNYTEGADGKKSRAYFTIASDRAGEGVDFVPVTVFGKTADAAAQYLGQGHQVAITGHIASFRLERDGQTTYGLDVIGDRVDFLGNPAGSGGADRSLANTATANAHRDPDAPGR